jgi:dihydroorotate dehydrogenase subfamily 1
VAGAANTRYPCTSHPTPLGRRLTSVVERRDYGPYRVLTAADRDGPIPQPGQFYMLTAAERWGGGEDERPFLPRAFSVMRARDGLLEFLLEDVGPGTNRLAELRPGDEMWVLGPLGNGFTRPRDGRRPILVGGGVGIAPLAIWGDHLGAAALTLLGFRDAAHAEGARLLRNARIATDDGSRGHHGLVTARRAAADARGGAGHVRRAGRPGAVGHGVGHGLRFRRLLWLRRPHQGRLRAPLRRRPRSRGGGTVIEFCGIELEHRIVNGSGTFDAIAARRVFGDALLERFPFAAFVSKTVTLEPRQGNPPPRLWELPGGMMNSIGLPNKGLRGYLAEDLPQLAELPVPLIVNVMGSRREDVATLVSAFAERDEVAALELNVSCPNVKTGLIMGADPAELAGLLDAVRPRTDKPLIVKLTPNCASPADVAAAAEDRGADAVSLINTLRGMAFDPHRPGEPWLGGGTGGVSGPAVRAIALSQVREVRQRVGLPIVGLGGVQTGRHFHDLREAGADLVAVGTESFRDPMAATRIREGASRFTEAFPANTQDAIAVVRD